MSLKNVTRWQDEAIILGYGITDEKFSGLLDYVLGKIPEEQMNDFPSFNVDESSAKEGAMVYEDNIIFDMSVLNKYSDKVKIGTIAHELAHEFLRHDETSGLNEEVEAEADEQASEWGFSAEIREMRKEAGPPTDPDCE